MSPNDPLRRGFLRGLLTLPLIGGSVTLLGNPSRAAEPFTAALMAEYHHWLAIERSRVALEMGIPSGTNWFRWEGPAYRWHEGHDRGHLPSTRAAVVLAAVGCDWREVQS